MNEEGKTIPAELFASPVACLAFLPRLIRIAESMGYALCIHGSLKRDYDFVAVAWTHSAKPPEELVDAFVATTGGWVINDPTADPYDYTRHSPEPKPHGRLGWTIHLGGGPYIDLSVIPPEPNSIDKLMDRLEASAEKHRQLLK